MIGNLGFVEFILKGMLRMCIAAQGLDGGFLIEWFYYERYLFTCFLVFWFSLWIIPRNCNKVADILARLALSGGSNVWIEDHQRRLGLCCLTMLSSNKLHFI